MRRALTVGAVLVSTAALMSGCGDEDPTDVGAGLVDPALTTFEVVLGPEQFLIEDTTFDELGSLASAPFLLLANDLDGSLDAHALVRIQRPDDVTWTDTTGTSRTDSIVSFKGARVTLVIDSLGPLGGQVEVEVLPLVESWHAPTATWELRYDTAGVAEPWTQPGGTTGPVAGSTTWSLGVDTIVIDVDSAAATVWQDSAGAFNGALLRTATPESRLRITTIRFQFLVVPESRTDTVVTAGSGSPVRMIADPEPAAPAGSVLRVGGLPIWRSLLHFRDLDELTLPYGAGAGCGVPMEEATVNLATLLLQPVPGGPFRLETPVLFDGRAVLEAPTVPLSRSPLSAPLGRTENPIGIDRFITSPPDDEPVPLPITPYIRRLLDDSQEEVLDWLALTSTSEGSTFGYATFASLESDTPPRLRLVVSVPTEQLPCNGLD